jgi:hypothetical protein
MQMRIPINISDLLISVFIPMFMIIFAMILKSWKKIKRSTGLDFIICLILFNSSALYAPLHFRVAFSASIKDQFVTINIAFILVEILLLLFCVHVESMLGKRNDETSIYEYCLVNALGSATLKPKYTLKLGFYEFGSWFLVSGFIGLNIFVYIIP